MNDNSLVFAHFSAVIVISGECVSSFAVRFVYVTLNLNRALHFSVAFVLGLPLHCVKLCMYSELSPLKAVRTLQGVREAIELERQEVLALRDSLDSVSLHSAQSQGRLYETERRLRFTERYVKRLECHLAEIERLVEQYGKQQRLRDATERLAAAYSSSSGAQVSHRSFHFTASAV